MSSLLISKTGADGDLFYKVEGVLNFVKVTTRQNYVVVYQTYGRTPGFQKLSAGPFSLELWVTVSNLVAIDQTVWSIHT